MPAVRRRRTASGSALAPLAAIAAQAGLELDLGGALAGAARHDFVTALADIAQTGRPRVQGQTNGVENGRLAGAAGADDGEKTGIGVFRLEKINPLGTGQRVEITAVHAEDFHDRSTSLFGLQQAGDGQVAHPVALAG